MIIGIYKIWTLFSYLGLLFGVVSIYFALLGNFKLALVALLLTSLVDTFDGTLARKFKRTKNEEQFGIEIDSILDTVNFGVIPVILFLSMGYTQWYHYLISFIFLFVVTMRLAYFNSNMVFEKGDNKKYELYFGFPVTVMPMFLILGYEVFLLTKLNIIMPVTMVIASILFITRIKLKRYKNKWFNLALISIGLLLTILLFVL